MSESVEGEKVDSLVEIEQDTCGTCGAYMVNPALHKDWHERQRQQFIELDRKASRLTGMETYG
jgi:hypothetical protein